MLRAVRYHGSCLGGPSLTPDGLSTSTGAGLLSRLSAAPKPYHTPRLDARVSLLFCSGMGWAES
jgi:hypothetical protein